MESAVHYSIVLPAYNEETRLEPTIRDVIWYFRGRSCSCEVIVVDDGSVDGTGALVRRLAEQLPEVRLIRLPENRGKGYAVRAGVVNARGALILFADADGSTPIAEIERLEAALWDGADLAMGSRALQGEGVTVKARLHRRLVGRVFHALVTILTVRGFRDTQCGFKLFGADVAHDLFSRMRMSGFSFDVELLMMARRRGYRVDEIPVNWVHQPGSRVNLVLDSTRMARDLFVIRFRALRGDYEEPHLALLPAGRVSMPAEDTAEAASVARTGKPRALDRELAHVSRDLTPPARRPSAAPRASSSVPEPGA